MPLDQKYKTKDVGAKKFIMGRFLDFKMVDSKTVANQVQEFQVIIHEIHAEGIVVMPCFPGVPLTTVNCETLYVSYHETHT